jgi:hypothetical protein
MEAKDITGQKFGKLTVIKSSIRDKHGILLWLCKCECKNETNVRYYSLKVGTTRSCGSKLCRSTARRKVKDITNKKFGKLTAISYTGVIKNTHAVWLCRCDCGNEKNITSSTLLKGTTKSCGCLKRKTKSLKL